MTKALNYLMALSVAAGFATPAGAAAFQLVALDANGRLTWTNAFSNGVGTVETAASVTGPWTPLQNVFTSNSVGAVQLAPDASRAFYRMWMADISGTAEGFTNLCFAYSTLQTIAGKGDFGTDGFNGWEERFEGGPATDAELSRPHFAMADAAGNIYIADKDAHAIRKVTPDGRIFTVAGMNEPGDDGDQPGPGIRLHLDSPNGLWVRSDGTVYILDLDNGKIRRLSANGVMSTLFKVSGGIDSGRGLWVNDDETLAYVASGNSVKKWTPGSGVKTFANGFAELGNLVVDPGGKLVVTDRQGHRVYRLSDSGDKTVIAGNGETSGGGDGALATETGLNEVRGVWFLPNGGYFLATHQGSQIWYVDTVGIIHLFVDGSPHFHDGDGEYFRSPGYKISEVRAITMDGRGNLIITENDNGFIRVVRFLRRSQSDFFDL